MDRNTPSAYHTFSYQDVRHPVCAWKPDVATLHTQLRSDAGHVQRDQQPLTSLAEAALGSRQVA